MIFVDKPITYLDFQMSPMARRYGVHVKWSHLFSDSDTQELHDFALKLGLKREWFQDKKKFPHYDIVESKVKLAVSLGAQEIDLKEYFKNKILEQNKKL